MLTLSHGVKENLVERVEEWPGVHGVHSLLTGEPMTGIWRDRSAEYFARRRSKKVEPRQFVTTDDGGRLEGGNRRHATACRHVYDKPPLSDTCGDSETFG